MQKDRIFWNRKIENPDSMMSSFLYLHKITIVLGNLLFRKGNMLDVGIGYGLLEKILYKLNTKLHLFGIDFSDLAIKRIRKKVTGNFVRCEIPKIPFKERFDYIVCLDVLEHLPTPLLKNILKTIRSRLKRNGIFILSVPVNESMEDYKQNLHRQQFQEDNLIKLLHRSGYVVKKIWRLTAFNKLYIFKLFLNCLTRSRKPNILIMRVIRSK